MVSGGALTGGSGGGVIGGGDSSESHDTDDIPDDTDSPPALRRRVADKLRPQSELINQILIDKFKVKFLVPSLILIVAVNATLLSHFHHRKCFSLHRILARDTLLYNVKAVDANCDKNY